MAQQKKYAVTGIGFVSPLGTGAQNSWQRLINGESAVRYEISSEAFVARAQGFDVPDNVRQLAMAFIALHESINDAGLKNSGYADDKIALCAGESKPNLFNRESVFPEQLKKVSGIKGPLNSISAACATGTLNIIKGCAMIEEGVCDAVICGSAETSIHPLYTASFKNMGVLAKGQNPCPFDGKRDGFAIGEGAGFIVIEELKRAVFRGAKVYCEIAGQSCGIFSSNALSVNSSAGMERIIKQASGNEIPDYIHMHGTGTKLNDYFESMAAAKHFGTFQAEKQNYKLQSLNSALPLASSTKAATGHMLGISGIAGAVFSILAIKDGIVPPTLNFTETNIPSGFNYVPQKSVKKTINSALSLSFGFGGQGAALLFKKHWGSVYA